MSQLRKIMQRLAQDQPAEGSISEAAASGSTDHLRKYLDAYKHRLAACTPAMLQYEWARLEEHISSLELCRSQPEMLATAGGKPHVEQLLLESLSCQKALQARMKERDVDPARHAHALVIGEPPWEIRQESIRRLWGMDGS
jgi:hypothetical protein